MYVFPFPHQTGKAGRIDQGQDFTGTGHILAIGNARVLKTGAGGWPEGGGVLYELLDGVRKGAIVFVYEGVDPLVHTGEIVHAGQPIANFRPGGSIETGFADRRGIPLSHVEYTAHYDGFETRAGKEMAAFLAHLKGSPGSGGSSSLFHDVKGTVDEAFELATGGVAGIFAGGGGDAGKSVRGVVGGVAGEVVEGIADLLGINAAKIMLNIGLVGGGAFLVYYGVARAVGVDEPVGTPLKAAGEAAAAGEVAA